MRRLIVLAATACAVALMATTASARVLLVGSFHGIKGQFTSIQAAVNAAHRGDWILIGPGDYKTTRAHAPRGFADRPAAVLITKSGLKLRGMNRNTVIIDGTKPGSPVCSRDAADQNLGPKSKAGRLGLNGVMVWKANNVWVQNMTACNFLGGAGHAGNEFWWNGGDGSAQIGGWGYLGTYLSATSTFFGTETDAAQYGIFSSNWDGGIWDHTYASNFNDSGYYIGACQQECNQRIDHAWSEFSVLGYSGSNSGGSILIENSEFDHNKDGFDTNSQNGDNPPPQDGSCPHNGISPITHTHSCWVFVHNYVHDNNNPNVPSAGLAAEGPVGTGISISGGRNDTVMNNRFVHNGAWGVILVPFTDSGPPCTGGTVGALGPGSCLFDDWGNALLSNTFSGNGFYGNPTNGDFAALTFENGHPTNCFRGNQEVGGKPVKPSSAALWQSTHQTCSGTPSTAGSSDPQFLTEVLCDSQVTGVLPHPCLPTDKYPRFQRVVMHPLPKAKLATMPNPCKGVPTNRWCKAGKPVV